MRLVRLNCFAFAAMIVAAQPLFVYAWGDEGHQMVNRLAAGASMLRDLIYTA